MVLFFCSVVGCTCNYLRYRTQYEVEIQYVNLSDTYKHYTGILPCFSDHIYAVVLYLEDRNVHRLILKNKTATMFFVKKPFSSYLNKLNVLIDILKRLGPFVYFYDNSVS